MQKLSHSLLFCRSLGCPAINQSIESGGVLICIFPPRIRPKHEATVRFHFFLSTQLSSLRNEVRCAGILLPESVNLWKQSTFLLPLTLGGASFHHITAIRHINRLLFLHQQEAGSSPGLRKTRIRPRFHSCATHWAQPWPLLTFPD